MDHMLACTICQHPIGVHSADGCRSATRLREACPCGLNAADVVDATLRDDEMKRARLLSQPVQFRTTG